MNAIDAIMHRRSIRAYLPRPVEADKLETLLTCAVNAPSANDQQSWHFTLITDNALLRAFEDEFSRQAPARGEEWRARVESGYRVLHGAPAAILISAPDVRDINAGIAAENICIAAESMGLGTCMIGLVRIVFESPVGREWADRLLCPADRVPALMITVGYPAPAEPREKVIKPELISRIAP